MTIDYEYDQFSNRKKMTVSGAQSYTVDYTYNVKNWLTRDVKVEGSVTTTTTYSYDANGNQTGISSTGGVVSTTTMVYDGFDQMVSVTKDGTVSTYAYRPDGLRYSKTAGGATTVHAWDGTNIAADIGGNAARYIRGVGLIALDQGTLQYYHFNANGDVVQRTDQYGNVTKNYRYNAFGVEQAMDAADSNPFRYSAEYYDKEIDVIYLRARYYKPVVGRFWAEDIIKANSRTLPNEAEVTDPLSLNLYTYVLCNPILYRDPSGNVAVALVLLAAATLGAVVGGIGGGISAYQNGENIAVGIAGGAIVGGLVGVAGAAAGVVVASVGATVGATAAVGGAISAFTGVIAGGANAAYQSYYNSETGKIDTERVFLAAGYTGLSALFGGLIGGAAGGAALGINSLGEVLAALTIQLQTGLLDLAGSLILDEFSTTNNKADKSTADKSISSTNKAASKQMKPRLA